MLAFSLNFFIFCYFYLILWLDGFYDFTICAIITIILVINFLLLSYKNIFLFLMIFQVNLIILIILTVMLIIIFIVITMIMTIIWGWIFNLCFCFFIDRKLTIYICYLIVANFYLILIRFVFFSLLDNVYFLFVSMYLCF